VHAPLVPSADRSRPLPASAGDRLDQARAAVSALEHERRRLERIGFETPLARCHEQLRYWRFVSGLLALPPGAAAAPGDPTWAAAPRR
jgi:hypothetical protein